jgi:hypothetical protein
MRSSPRRNFSSPPESDSSWRPPPDFRDPPAQWRMRPPLESTTYSIIPEAKEPSPSEAPPQETLTPSQATDIGKMFASLEALTHYELLGITPDASLDAIRSAYQQLAAVFHPNRFARKRTGDAHKKLERIRARIDEAYATLASTDARARYDLLHASPRRTP